MTNLNDKANEFLMHLAHESSPFWKVAINTAYEGDALGGKAIASTTRKLARLGVDTNQVLGYPMSPLAAGTAYFEAETVPLRDKLLPSQIAKIISVLKEENKILQVGAGRGKVTLILSQNIVNADAKSYFVPRDDPGAIVEAMIATVAGFQGDVKTLQEKNAFLIERVTVLEAHLIELQQDAEIHANSTWA